MHLSPRLSSWIAATALVAVFVAIGAFVVVTMRQTKEIARDVQRSSALAGAFDEARLQVARTNTAAARFLAEPTAERREAFDAQVAATAAAFEAIKTAGDEPAQALVAALYERDLPALEHVQALFVALERGEPFTGPLPDPQMAERITAQLEAPAREQEAQAAADLERLTSRQAENVRLTVMVCAVGLVLVMALLAALHAYGRREGQAQAELRQLRLAALTDSLTGLGNHRAIMEELRRQVARSTRHGEKLALAMIDVDEFKQVNDTWGHARGDKLLRDVAKLLTSLGREEDYQFRIGGDEFAIILPYCDGPTSMMAMERIRSVAAETLTNDVTVSIGVGLSKDCAGDDEVLRQQADSALYEAKLRGRNAALLFHPSEGLKPVFPAAKTNSVRKLLADGAMTAAFQPIWNLTDGTLLAYEALARIPAEYELSGPQQAFDIAERIGKAAELDRACRMAILKNVSSLPDGCALFINVSPYTLAHASFSVPALVEEIEAAGLTPARVVFEITERSTVALPVIEEAVIALRAAGFRAALVDVGAGNAGLEMLRRVPVEFVKIDRAVLVSALRDTMGRAAVMAIVAFAAQVGALVVAEGIEDDSLLELVQWIASGGDGTDASMVYAVQGFMLGRPEFAMDAARKSDGLAA